MSAEEAPNDYVRNKAESERMLFSLGDVPVVTVRPPYVYRPENPFYREAFFFDRLMLGRPIIIPGDGGRLLQFVYVDDLARAMVAMLSNPAAVRQAAQRGAHYSDEPARTSRTIRKVMGRRDVDAGLVPCPRRSSSATGATCSAAPVLRPVRAVLQPLRHHPEHRQGERRARRSAHVVTSRACARRANGTLSTATCSRRSSRSRTS